LYLIALERSIIIGLILKFKQLGESLFLMTQKIEDIEKLQKIQDALLVINDADEFKRFI
jgi:hypothetical protein